MLTAILVGSLPVERPWCRWLCPFGALQGVIARLSPWTIRRNESVCISCGKCSRVCPFSIQVDRVSAVRDGRCNRCTHCVAACPVPGALDFANAPPAGAALRGISLSGGITAALVAVTLFLLPAGIARATGGWVRESTVSVATLTPDEIGPTMTLSEVSEGFAIAPLDLLELLEIDHDFDPNTRLFDIEEDERYEHITVGWVRQVLSDAPAP